MAETTTGPVETTTKVASAARAAAQAAADDAARGYVSFRYHGVEMWRALDAQDQTFETERAAQEWVMQTRVTRNLGG